MGAKATKITYYDGSYYEGQVNSSGKEHGQGRIYYGNGDFLKGNFLQGDCVYAILTKKNGDSYDGQMRDHKYHGTGKLITKNYQQNGLFRDNRFVHGKITFADGSSYEGSLAGGHKVGRAHFVSKDGTVYTGYFRQDKFDGSGEVTYKSGQTYTGTFKNGIYHGKGHLKRFSHGVLSAEYEGQFKQAQFHGEGRLKLIDLRQQYVGHFVDGKKHGHGTYTYSQGDIYEGNYNQDVREDEHCSIHLNGGSTYRGGIKNGIYHGRGVLNRSNGDYYQGQFVEGKKHGYGVLKAGDAVYEGQFLDDKKQGKGKITYHNDENEIFEGSFENDLKHGKGILQGRTQYFEANFVHGQKEGPYRKKMVDYLEQGSYSKDKLHGKVKIQKGEYYAIYLYEYDNKLDQVHE